MASGDPKVIEFLNDALKAELTAIHQYRVHGWMLENWGYQRLANKKLEEAQEETEHANKVIQRILFLGGAPDLQTINPLRVGADPVAMHENDLAMEVEASERYNHGVTLARDCGDNGTRALLEFLVTEEEHSIHWHESQLHLVKQLGAEAYLAEQLFGKEG